MIECVGGIVREITGTVIFGVCKVKGKNVERWPTQLYGLDINQENFEVFCRRTNFKRYYTFDDDYEMYRVR